MLRRSPVSLPARRSAALQSALSAVLGACTAVPTAAPPIPARPVPVPVVTPPPAPAPSSDWRDWPLTPGDWSYRRDARGSLALFGVGGTAAQAMLRCDVARRRVYLSRLPGAAVPAASATLSIRTSSVVRAVAAVAGSGTPAYWVAEFDVRDPLLDAMAFSRGRFVIETAGAPRLVIPAWAEVSRVIEDCRG